MHTDANRETHHRHIEDNRTPADERFGDRDLVSLAPLPVRGDPTAALIAIDRLTPSARPAEAFVSLADACASTFADECWVTVEDREITMTTAPRTLSPPGDDEVLVIDMSEPGQDGMPPFTVRFGWRWFDPDRPTAVDRVIARLLLDTTAQLVRIQRLATVVAAERDKATQLRNALDSNREIAQAVGILMSTHKITSEAAFDLLRAASQHTHRKLRDIAVDVRQTGTLELP
jgi:hypothetical protein